MEVKEVPVKAHNSVSKVKIAVKAVNNTAGPNGLIPTLLVFGSYLRITEDSPPSPTIT